MSFPPFPPFNKAGNSLCFRRKATSQELEKKLFLVAVEKINNSYKNDYKTQLRSGGHCDILCYLLFRLVWDVK